MQPRSAQAVLVDAATRPLNLIGGAAMVGASIVLNFPLAAALIIYLLLVLASVVDIRTKGIDPGSFQVREALLTLPPQLRARVSGVLAIADEIRDDLATMDVEPGGVRDGLDQMTITVIETAQRADEVDRYLDSVSAADLRAQLDTARQRAERDPSMARTADARAEQLAVVERLAGRRAQLDAQIEQISASLGAIQARVVQARVESAAPTEFEGELTELRDRTRALAESFSEVDAASDAATLAQAPPPADAVTSAIAQAELDMVRKLGELEQQPRDRD